jgi:hypothetical protein
MKLISNYKVFLDKKFIVEYHQGTGNLKNIKAFKLKEASDLNYSPDYNLLVDVRATSIEGIRNDVREYIEFARSHKGISGNRKLAVITNTPRHVVFFTFLNMFKMRLPQTMKIFSSLDAAMYWLGEPISIEDANDCLMNLKNNAKSYEESK